jgi:hypothetical protein
VDGEEAGQPVLLFQHGRVRFPTDTDSQTHRPHPVPAHSGGGGTPRRS